MATDRFVERVFELATAALSSRPGSCSSCVRSNGTYSGETASRCADSRGTRGRRFPAVHQPLREEPPMRERVLGEQALAEGVIVEIAAWSMRRSAVFRRCRGLIEDPRVLRRGAFWRLPCNVDELREESTDSTAQLGRGALGEGHDQHLRDVEAFAQDLVHHEVLDDEGLSRTGRRLDDVVATGIEPVECLRTRVDGVLRAAHRATPFFAAGFRADRGAFISPRRRAKRA